MTNIVQGFVTSSLSSFPSIKDDLKAQWGFNDIKDASNNLSASLEAMEREKEAVIKAMKNVESETLFANNLLASAAEEKKVAVQLLRLTRDRLATAEDRIQSMSRGNAKEVAALKSELISLKEDEEEKKIDLLKSAEVVRADVAEDTPVDATKAAEHSIFGSLVADLGYKRVYRTSVSQLKNLPVWEKQRVFSQDRAKKIFKDKMTSARSRGIPGVITIYEMGDQRGILDGQHRVGGLSLLSEGTAPHKEQELSFYISTL